MRLSFVAIVLAVIAASAVVGFAVVGPALRPAFVEARVAAQNAAVRAPAILALPNSTAAWLYVPAVDQDGNGVISTVAVQAVPGSGRTLANIEDILFWVDTQRSIQLARAVAENITGKNLSRYDLIYTIEADAQLIEGPSAGAALTIATVAAVQARSLDRSVLITGTIEPDGSIGRVGGILEKAAAAAQANATLLLVPLGDGTVDGNARRVRECAQQGVRYVCSVRYVAEQVPIDADITVREVASVEEALEYFLTG